jgi:hypothetical protein
MHCDAMQLRHGECIRLHWWHSPPLVTGLHRDAMGGECHQGRRMPPQQYQPRPPLPRWRMPPVKADALAWL